MSCRSNLFQLRTRTYPQVGAIVYGCSWLDVSRSRSIPMPIGIPCVTVSRARYTQVKSLVRRYAWQLASCVSIALSISKWPSFGRVYVFWRWALLAVVNATKGLFTFNYGNLRARSINISFAIFEPWPNLVMINSAVKRCSYRATCIFYHATVLITRNNTVVKRFASTDFKQLRF